MSRSKRLNGSGAPIGCGRLAMFYTAYLENLGIVEEKWRMVHFFANTLNFSVFAKMQNSAQFRVNSAISTAFYFVKWYARTSPPDPFHATYSLLLRFAWLFSPKIE